MRRLLPLTGLAAAALVLTASSSARASSDGEAYLLVAAVAIFDVASLPADIYMHAKGEKIPHDYAMTEAIAGGIQGLAGGIGLVYCAGDRSCRKDPGFPALIGFTAWTTVMSLHGVFSLATEQRGHASLGPRAPAFSIVPMVGDGRTTPAGLGITGTF